MLFELSIYEAVLLQSACESAQCLAAKNAGAAESCAVNPDIPEKERASAARVAKWYRNRASEFEAVNKVLGEGREITTLEQAKEALER